MSISNLYKKLRLSPGLSVLIINAPPEYSKMLKNISFDSQDTLKQKTKYDFIQIFSSEKSILTQLVKEYWQSGKYDCLFWICYPKGGGKIKSDINRNSVWNIAQSVGMQCVTQIAIDETWSALRVRPIDKVGK